MKKVFVIVENFNGEMETKVATTYQAALDACLAKLQNILKPSNDGEEEFNLMAEEIKKDLPSGLWTSKNTDFYVAMRVVDLIE